MPAGGSCPGSSRPSPHILNSEFTVKRIFPFVVAVCVAVGLASPAAGQDVPEPEDLARFRLGPIRFTPAIALTNIGVDTNVFNEFDDPKQDFTIAFGPKVDYWVRLGRARLAGRSSADYNYFQEYDSQRFWDIGTELKLSVPLNRIVPFVSGSYANTRQRPGYEIDVRAKRTQGTARAGVDLRLGARTTVTVAAGVQQQRYDAEEVFLGADLSDALDSDADGLEVTVARQLTPLTTFVVTAEQRRDRFVYSHERNADALRVVTGFDLKPFALISGNIRVGWRDFRTTDALVPDYAGLVASGELAYTLRATRFGVRLRRDIEYSYQQFQPYYLLTDVGLEVTQRITTSWDAVGRIGRQTLDYRAVALDDGVARTDRAWRQGGGVGYRLGEVIRLGVDVDRYERASDIVLRTYDAWRIGGSVTYGIKTP
jgi:opacity protein-like surface antigen